MPPSVFPPKARSSTQLSCILESDDESVLSLNGACDKTETTDSIADKTTDKATKRWSLFSTWRLNFFYRVAVITQSPIFVAFVYILMTCNTVYPMVEFLRCTALPEDYSNEMLEIEPTVMIAVGFRLCVLAGLPNLVLLLLGSGVLADSGLILQLALDVACWMATLFTWAFGLATVDEWTDENIAVLSACGLFGSIQINTFMAVRSSLVPLIATTSSQTGAPETVSTDTIVEVIEKSKIRGAYKEILKEEVYLFGHDQFGRVDVFQFTQRVLVWIDRWTSFASDTTEKEKNKFKALLENLQWSTLLTNILHERESQLFKLEDDDDDHENKNSNPRDTGRHTNSSGTVISTILTALKHLTEKSKLKFLLLVLTLGFQAATKYWKNLIVGTLVDEATNLAENDDGQRSSFGLSLLYVALLVAGNCISYYIASAIGASLVSNSRARVQRELARRVLYGGSKFEECWSMGTLTNTFNTSLAREEAVFASLMFKMVNPAWHLVAAVACFCFINVGYALFSVSVIPFCFIIKNNFEKCATSASEKFNKSSAILSGGFANILAIRKAADFFGSQSFLLQKLEDKVQRTMDDSFESALWGFVFSSSFNTTGTFLLLITTLILLVALSRGKITSGEFFAISTFVTGMITPLEQLGSVSGKVAYQSGAVMSIEKLLQYDPEYLDSDHDCEGEDDGNDVSLTLTKELHFEHVAFRYREDCPLVLQDITASITAGSYVCVFGTSGSGKSTLLSLLEGFQKATGGRILMDGVDIASVPLSQLRARLGVVFQETFILDGTVKDNILFGYDTSAKSREEIKEAVVEAAKDAQIHDFIMKNLPNKYNTVIGSESDVNLSGGQLQRICGLARALIRKPELLLLDECTSALDTISEQAVIDTIVKLSKEKGMTILSISHHPITAVQADNILVLKDGLIDQSGAYDSLISQPGLFAELAEAGGHSSSMLGSSASFFLPEDDLHLLKQDQSKDTGISGTCDI